MFFLSFLSFVDIDAYKKAPFDAYSGYWYFKKVPSDPDSQRIRLFVEVPKNETPVQFVRATIQIPVSPTAKIPYRPFVTPGVFLRPLNGMFLVYSQEPMVQFQKKSIRAEIEDVGRSILKAASANNTNMHRQSLDCLAQHKFPANVLTLWLDINGTVGARGLNGSMIVQEVVLNVSLTEYNYLEYQVRWRSLLVLTGLGVAIMHYACLLDEPVGGDISALSVMLCMSGEYSMLLLLYFKKDDFDIGDNYGFTFVGAFAFWIAWYYLGVRYDRARSAVQSAYDDVPLIMRWLMIAGLHNALLYAPVWAMLIRMSYWVPQIIFSAIGNNMRSVNMKYAALFTIGQLFCASAILLYHPHYKGMLWEVMVPTVAWSAVELAVIALQNAFGGAFFIPRHLRSERFDYKAEVPPDGTECEICLSEITNGESYLSTPCHHYFHEACLMRWVREQHTCPVCREPLPGISVSD